MTCRASDTFNVYANSKWLVLVCVFAWQVITSFGEKKKLLGVLCWSFIDYMIVVQCLKLIDRYILANQIRSHCHQPQIYWLRLINRWWLSCQSHASCCCIEDHIFCWTTCTKRWYFLLYRGDIMLEYGNALTINTTLYHHCVILFDSRNEVERDLHKNKS